MVLTTTLRYNFNDFIVTKTMFDFYQSLLVPPWLCGSSALTPAVSNSPTMTTEPRVKLIDGWVDAV